MKGIDLKNKRVTVMGLGRLGGGVGVVTFLAKQGAKLIVTDIKKKEELGSSLELLRGLPNIEFVLGQHRKEDFIDRDFIVKNPGVPTTSPYLRVAKDNGIAIETDIGLFFQLTKASIIGVTGTKGKSTTSSLIYELLKTSYTVFLAGNIGRSPLEVIHETDANSLVVLELSSWQLQDIAWLGMSPHAAVILNIYPDHFNYHADLNDYVDAKKVIMRFQKPDDVAILNYDDETVRNFSSQAQGKVRFFSTQKKLDGVFLEGDYIYLYQGAGPLTHVSDIALKGSHNLSNICAALSVAEMYKVRAKDMRRVLQSFKGIPYRQEFIRDIHGITFINDTTATNPHATLAALDRFRSPLILIAGGVDKNLSYADLASAIARRVRFLILLPGSASQKIKSHLASLRKVPPLKEVASMKEAVLAAFGEAHSGDTVLLSPGAASFNIFQNEFDRGDQFSQAVNSL